MTYKTRFQHIFLSVIVPIWLSLSVFVFESRFTPIHFVVFLIYIFWNFLLLARLVGIVLTLLSPSPRVVSNAYAKEGAA